MKLKPKRTLKTHPTVPVLVKHTPRQPMAFPSPAKPAPKKRG